MSIKLPAGHGATAIPFRQHVLFKNNLPIVIRECLANSITFGASRCHAVRLLFPDGDLYLCFMHNGKPFKDGIEEIKSLGLTPNMSGAEGWSFQGNGLTYCASYLADMEPKLIIASKKDDESLAVASATIDYMKNDWVIKDEPTWDEKLKEILGQKWYEAMNVLYLFRLRPSEKASEKDGGVGKGYGMKYNNNLSFLAPTMVSKDSKNGGSPNLTISESIFYTGRSGNQGRHYANLSETLRGSWQRVLSSSEEYLIRFCEKSFTFETEPFTLKREGWEYGLGAEITIHCCPGIQSIAKSGNDNRQWLANVRDGVSVDSGKSFEKGKSVGIGVPPSHTTYLYVPIINDGLDERFSRFKDNAVGFSWRSQNLFSILGLPYREPALIRRKKKGEHKPFAIMQVKLTKLHEEMRSTQTDEVHSVNPIYFANAFGRRPDFLFSESASTDILSAVMEAGYSNVLEDCRKWFVDHFPTNEEERVPITFGTQHVTQESDDYTIYDLNNGKKFKMFHVGKTHILAIWSRRLKKFVTDITDSSMNRGITITRMQHQTLDVVSDSIKKSYKAIHESHVANHKIMENELIPFFSVSVTELSHLEEDGTWKPITIFNYQHTDEYRPSRGVHGIIDSANLRLGSVEEVPPRKGKGSIPKRKRVTLGGKGITKRTPYCERDHRILVEWDNKNKVLMLNVNNPQFGILYDRPDEVGSKSQKALEELYFTLRSIAFGTALGVADPITSDHRPVTGGILGEDGRPIYDDSSRWDYVVNKAIEQFMADSPYVRNIKKIVEEYRSKKIA